MMGTLGSVLLEHLYFFYFVYKAYSTSGNDNNIITIGSCYNYVSNQIIKILKQFRIFGNYGATN